MVLQRLDHAGIWVLIAGTFTPVHVILFRGAWRWSILLVVWTIAITGLVLEVIFFQSFPEWLILSLFLGLGWMGTLTAYKFKSTFQGESLKWLAWGGIFYSIGACFDFLRWPILWLGILGPHEIFHIFVILGSWAHWFFIYSWADHPVGNSLTFEIQIYPDNFFKARALGESLQLTADSLEVLKLKIHQAVMDKFHSSFSPQIHLIYTQRENLVAPHSN